MNKLMILSVVALLLPIVPALACFPDSDGHRDNDKDEVLFTSEQRTSTEDCQANGLNPGSYFDEKGRIVGSPCDPVEYCEDTSSTDIAVVDYCSDTWNEQGIDREDRQGPEPESGPILDTFKDFGMGNEQEQELQDCSHEGLGTDGCRPVEEDNHEEEDTEESEDDKPTVEEDSDTNEGE